MKAAFRHILLAALLIRALLPLGWMPGQAQLGEAAFVICAADGTLQHGMPGKDGEAKPHQPCAFAAASQIFDLPEAAHIPAPSVARLPGTVLAAADVRTGAIHRPHAARAPPLTV